MRRVFLLLHCGFLAPLAPACRTAPPTLDKVLSDFQDENTDLSFMDCKYGEVDCVAGDKSATGQTSSDFRNATSCLVETWQASCKPSMTSLTWNWRDGSSEDLELDDVHTHRYIFTVPHGDECRLAIFESTDAYSVTRLECNSFVTEGVCGVLEPRDCHVVEKIEISPSHWE